MVHFINVPKNKSAFIRSILFEFDIFALNKHGVFGVNICDVSSVLMVK